MSSQKNTVQPAPRRISKFTTAVMSFIFGVGVVVVGVAIGRAIPPSASWAAAHSVLVVKAGICSLILPVIWLCGRPLAMLLDRK